MELQNRTRQRELFNPLAEFTRLQDEINKLFDLGGLPEHSGIFDRSLSPALDVLETGDTFQVSCELPGVEHKDLAIDLANNILTIKGTKKIDRDSKGDQVYKAECWAGSFQRTLSLPNTINPDGIEAVMQDGVLRITLPKREELKPKQITVQVS